MTAQAFLFFSWMATWTASRFKSLPPHIWLGVTVESDADKGRIRQLQGTPAAIRFLSLEPLIGPVMLDSSFLKGIHWAIVGGESGPRARYMSPGWVADLRDQCLAQKVPFFFKQWGGVNKKKAGRLLDGRTWDEIPQVELAGV